MKRSHRFHRWALIRYWFALSAACLIVVAAPKDDPASLCALFAAAPPVLFGAGLCGVFQGTGVSPAKDIMERARRWENREMDAYVSVFFGFAYADVPDVGATVMVIIGPAGNDMQTLPPTVVMPTNSV